MADHIEVITFNTRSYAESRPEVACVAEAVLQYLDAMVSSDHFELPRNAEPHVAVRASMALAACHSWTLAYIFSSAGLLDSSLASLRRCAEYACCAAKVKGNNERALDWLKQLSDPERRLSFSRWSRIPTAFRNEKYRFLRPLINSVRLANRMLHGNFEAMVGNLSIGNESLEWSFISREFMDRSTPLIALLGYRLASALTDILEPQKDRKTLDEMLAFIGQKARDMRLSHAAAEGDGSIPGRRLLTILLDDPSGSDEQFMEFLNEEETWAQFRRDRLNRKDT